MKKTRNLVLVSVALLALLNAGCGVQDRSFDNNSNSGQTQSTGGASSQAQDSVTQDNSDSSTGGLSSTSGGATQGTVPTINPPTEGLVTVKGVLINDKPQLEYKLPSEWSQKVDEVNGYVSRTNVSDPSDKWYSLRVIKVKGANESDAQAKAKNAYNQKKCAAGDVSDACNPGPQYREVKVGDVNVYITADYSTYLGRSWGTVAYFFKEGQMYWIESSGTIDENIESIASVVQTIKPL